MSYVYGFDTVQTLNSACLGDAVRALSDLGAHLPFPSFCGRYITGDFGLATDEIAFAAKVHLPILLIYNEISPSMHVSYVKVHVDRIVRVIREHFGVFPREGERLTVWADVEAGWPITPEWVVAWAQEMRAAGLYPGIYLAPYSYPGGKINDVTHAILREGVLVWTAHWTSTSHLSAFNPAAYSAYAPSRIWQVLGNYRAGDHAFDIDMTDEDMRELGALMPW